jgi:hypothetical protein
VSIDIFVQRGAGDRPGDNIVDPLITSIPVAVQRGRNELDERATAQQDVTRETLFRAGVRCGQLARVVDFDHGETWLGKITGITHTVRKADESVQLTTSLSIRRPTKFYA